jgi:hypothetical protein
MMKTRKTISTSSSKNKLKRYHRNIFFPEIAEESLDFYINSLMDSGPITFSYHSVDKIISSVSEYGIVLWKCFSRIISNKFLSKEKIFEFYCDKFNETKKACFRFPLESFPVDLILVISNNGVVITVYLSNRDDNHDSINRNLYSTD